MDWKNELLQEIRALRWEGRSDETSMPPCQDTRAEVKLLAAMLRGRVLQCDPEWFYDDLHAWMARHVLTSYSQGIKLTVDHLLELAGPRGIADDTIKGLWTQLQGVSWHLEPNVLADRVEEMHRRRLLCSRLRRVIVALETDQRGVDKALAYLGGLSDDT